VVGLRPTTPPKETIMKNMKLILGAFDAVTARLCKQKGADYIWASSLVSSAIEGREDTGITDAKVFSHFIENLNKGFESVIVDFDIGGRHEEELYSNAKVMKELKVKGVCIEDEDFPKINAMIASEKRKLIDSNVMAKKLSIFREVLDESSLVIARTHSLIANESLNELQDRVNVYSSAGADVIVIHYTGGDWDYYEKTISEINCSKPLMILLSKEDRIPDQLSKIQNLEYIAFPNQLYRTMLGALVNIERQHMIEGKKWEKLITTDEFFNLISKQEV